MAVDRNQVNRMRLFIKLNPKLSRAAREVFQEMLSLFSIHGKVFPSHKTLAGKAKCAERTVRRALDQFVALRIVSWRRRRRNSSVYEIDFEAAGVGPSPRPAVAQARGTAPEPVKATAQVEPLSQIGGSLAAFAALFEARRAQR